MDSTGPAKAMEPTGEGAQPDLSFGVIETSAGFLLRIAQLTAFDRFFEEYPSSGIKISEFTVLLAIAENPGVRQGVLADTLKIKWSNMTKLVRTLEQQEWVGRHIPPNDRRSVELHVTEKGKREIEAAKSVMLEADRKAVSALTDEEHAQLLSLLRKVAGWPATGEEASQ